MDKGRNRQIHVLIRGFGVDLLSPAPRRGAGEGGGEDAQREGWPAPRRGVGESRVRGRVLRGSHPRLISDAPSGLRGNGIRKFFTFQTASERWRNPEVYRCRDLFLAIGLCFC